MLRNGTDETGCSQENDVLLSPSPISPDALAPHEVQGVSATTRNGGYSDRWLEKVQYVSESVSHCTALTLRPNGRQCLPRASLCGHLQSRHCSVSVAFAILAPLKETVSPNTISSQILYPPLPVGARVSEFQYVLLDQRREPRHPHHLDPPHLPGRAFW